MTHKTKTTSCPKCGALALQTHDGKHTVGHLAHPTVHATMHGNAFLAFLGLAGMLWNAAGVFDSYRCTRCNHNF